MTRESNSGRRRRLTILVFGLTVLLGVTILLIATQREVSAQSTDQVVWESELTVGESTRSTLGWHSFGDYDGEGLSDQEFGVRGWLYEITWIELVQVGTTSNLDLTLHQVNSDAAEWISDFTLDVDGTNSS